MNRKLFFASLVTVFVLNSCHENTGPSRTDIEAIQLKRGIQVSCGSGAQGLGEVAFPISASKKVNKDFNLGIKLLHSFEYDEAEKVFAAIIDNAPGTLMAYWGVAMSNFHPLWTPPSEAELIKGNKALMLARQVRGGSPKETAYVDAINSFYSGWKDADHRTRCLRFEKAMQALYGKYPEDKEVTSFYALALTAAADPNDQGLTRQRKAGQLLTSLYPGEPNHPGIVHYIIHAYDSPELASLALPAARKYASVAPSSAHALHMPSHIFTRLGLWDESIQANMASVANAKCYAEATGIKGHWDEELHGLDYLAYAYLQKGDNRSAKQQWDYLATMKVVQPLNSKVAYAFAAIPSRYLLENRLWVEAAMLEANFAGIQWQKFPWQHSIIVSTRMMGAIHTRNTKAALASINYLEEIKSSLLLEKNNYQAKLVDIKIKTGRAWLLMQDRKSEAAIALMTEAAELEDKTEKHPVTPGEVIPAREYLADMLLELNQPGKALEVYESSLKKNQNRFNSLAGAALAAQKVGDSARCRKYYALLASRASLAQRPEAEIALRYVAGNGGK